MDTFKSESSFRGDRAFLSNMYACRIDIFDNIFSSVEQGYQWYKVADPEVKKAILNTDNPAEAKRLGRTSKAIETWRDCNLIIMSILIQSKFKQNKDLMNLLLNIEDKEITEYNNWHDNFWGSCICIRCKSKFKTNCLGKFITLTRDNYILGNE